MIHCLGKISSYPGSLQKLFSEKWWGKPNMANKGVDGKSVVYRGQGANLTFRFENIWLLWRINSLRSKSSLVLHRKIGAVKKIWDAPFLSELWKQGRNLKGNLIWQRSGYPWNLDTSCSFFLTPLCNSIRGIFAPFSSCLSICFVLYKTSFAALIVSSKNLLKLPA